MPLDLGDGATALGGDTQEERLEQAYQQTEQMQRGGTFPFGFGRRWHGGVHVPSFDAAGEEGSRDPRTVRAMLPGDIVAARLGPEPDGDDPNEHGSPNFILMQHDLSDVSSIPAPDDADDDDEAPAHPLFSLYMHLEERSPLDRTHVAADTPLFEQPYKASNRPLALAHEGFRFYSLGTIEGRDEYDGDTWHILDLGAVMPAEHAKTYIEDARSKGTPPVTDAEWAGALQVLRSHNGNGDNAAYITSKNLPTGEVTCSNQLQQALWTEVVKNGFGEDDIIGPLACVYGESERVERLGFEERVELASAMNTIRQKTLDLDRDAIQRGTLESLGENAPDITMCSGMPGAFQLYEIEKGGMNLRSYPSAAPDNRLDTLPAETAITVDLDCTPTDAFADGWVRVESRFGSGYIRRTTVEPNGWALTPDLLDTASSGDITVFDDPPHVQAGEAIWTVGRLYAHRADASEDAPHMDEAVHVGMFSKGEKSAYRLLAESLVASYTEEKAGPNASKLFSWTEAVDQENTEAFSMSFAPVQKALRDAEASHDEAEIVSEPIRNDHVLKATAPSREEIARFFAIDDTAAKMRHTAAKFVSEWTEAYPEGVSTVMPSHEPFLWWETVSDQLDTLDAPHVWHYNPLYLAGLLSSPPAPPPPPEMVVESVQAVGDAGFGRTTRFRARLDVAPSEDADQETSSLTADQRESGVSWLVESRTNHEEEFQERHAETGVGADYEMPGFDSYDRQAMTEMRVTAYPVGTSPEDGAFVSLRPSREERQVAPAY